MLIPAILKRDELRAAFSKKFYSDDLLFITAGLRNWMPVIEDDPEEGVYRYAIVTNDLTQKLVGYLDYKIDWYSSCASCFGLISFENGNPLIGLAVRETIDKLLNEYKLHRIEWRMLGGNPVERHYDKLCEKYHGVKHVLRDVFKDKYGKYHTDCIYEIIQDAARSES